MGFMVVEVGCNLGPLALMSFLEAGRAYEFWGALNTLMKTNRKKKKKIQSLIP